MLRSIYMDNQATTPVDPRVLEEMLPFFNEKFGNAASRSHRFGWEAEEACEKAREQIARLINAKAKEIIFTSGGTESDNIAIKGTAEFLRGKGDHIVTAATEHPAVLDTCKALERRGFQVSYLPVDPYGMVDPGDVRKALNDKTILVSIMHANNEIGTLNPILEIGKIAKEKGVLFHCDATQAVGKVPVDVEEMGIDLLSLSAHKIYGPKGAGALYARSRNPTVRLIPIFDGGGHERGMRSGTLNVPGIVGLGAASAICEHEMAAEQARLLALREKLKESVVSQIEETCLNGHPTLRVAGNLNLSFAYVEADSLMMALNGIALSSGSACTSRSQEPSHVLRALGIRDELAQGSIRFGLGRFNTEEEVEYVAGRVVEEVARLRRMSAAYAAAKRRADPYSVQPTHRGAVG